MRAFCYRRGTAGPVPPRQVPRLHREELWVGVVNARFRLAVSAGKGGSCGGGGGGGGLYGDKFLTRSSPHGEGVWNELELEARWSKVKANALKGRRWRFA